MASAAADSDGTLEAQLEHAAGSARAEPLLQLAWRLRRVDAPRSAQLAEEAQALSTSHELPEDVACRALAVRACAERHAGRKDAGLALAQEAIALAREASSPQAWALAHLARGSFALDAAAYAEARSLLQRGLEARSRGPLEDELLSPLQRSLGMALFRLGEVEEAEAAMRSAIAGAEAAGNPALIGRAHQGLAVLLDAHGRPEEADEAIRIALELAQASEDAELEGRARRLMGIAAGRRRDHGTALECFEHAARIERKAGVTRGLANTLNVLAMQYMALEMYAEARAFLEEALALRRATGDRAGLARTLYYMAYARAEQGDEGPALEAAEEALHLLREVGERSDLPFILDCVARRRRAAGDHAGALAAFDEEVAIGSEADRTEPIVLGLMGQAQVHLDGGSLEAARPLVERALAAAEALEQSETLAHAHSIAADLFEQTGEPVRALKHVRRCMKIEAEAGKGLVRAREKAERARSASEQRLAKAFRNSPDSITITRVADGHIHEVNRGFEELFGWTRSEALGRSTIDLGLWARASDRTEFRRQLEEHGRVKNLTAQGTTKSGGTLQAEISAELLDLDGETCVLTVVHDVTEREEAQSALRAALDEVKRLRDRLQEENLYLQEEIRDAHHAKEIVGTSRPMAELKAAIRAVARTDTTVLIAGETGTGKELVVRALHEASARRGRPLIKVNCAAVAAGLVESELFGHERGAFTGAVQQRKGRFELADHGSLFLDEVGELSADVQAKLLRVLEEGEFERVGSSAVIKTDVRLFTATNRDLEEEVAAGRFRSDLFYRLHVFPIRVPPLRERGSDVIELAQHFVRHFAARHGRAVEGLDGPVLAWLQAYPWPGNVRELRNLVERAVITAEGRLLGAAEFGGLAPPQGNSPISDASLEEVQRRHIVHVFEQTDWVIEGAGGAARILGLPAGTLRSRMQKLGIRKPGR